MSGDAPGPGSDPPSTPTASIEELDALRKELDDAKKAAASAEKKLAVMRAMSEADSTDSVVEYVKYQADSGAQVVQIFDSWASEFCPADFEKYCLPYLKRIVDEVKVTHPDLPLILYASGSGGLLERLQTTGADVISLDGTVDMEDARRRLGPEQAVQGNIDPVTLFASKEVITDRVLQTVQKAGDKKHVVNLGHGVMQGTPEEHVAHFFKTVRDFRY